jgi:acyl-CoA thioester hydrolase
MSRIKIPVPDKFAFSCAIPIRITDLNYGEHVGNDTILSIIHEARVQYLKSMGYSEMKFAGVGMIMADAAIEFRNEIFYGDVVVVSVSAGEITKVGFELTYKMETKRDDKMVSVAAAKTGMVCYDYEKKKIVAIPEEATLKLTFLH